jgi:hypothetical protein
MRLPVEAELPLFGTHRVGTRRRYALGYSLGMAQIG